MSCILHYLNFKLCIVLGKVYTVRVRIKQPHIPPYSVKTWGYHLQWCGINFALCIYR